MTIYLGTKAVGIDYQGNFSRIDNPCKYSSRKSLSPSHVNEIFLLSLLRMQLLSHCIVDSSSCLWGCTDDPFSLLTMMCLPLSHALSLCSHVRLLLLPLCHLAMSCLLCSFLLSCFLLALVSWLFLLHFCLTYLLLSCTLLLASHVASLLPPLGCLATLCLPCYLLLSHRLLMSVSKLFLLHIQLICCSLSLASF